MGKKSRKAKRRRQSTPSSSSSAPKAAPRKAAPSRPDSAAGLGTAAAVLANVLILGTLVVAVGLQVISADLYYRSVQEDELLEWATFWAFIIAAVVFAVAAFGQWHSTGLLPWFLSGIALFCFVVAMEEISWAQRVFGYRPPVYFLEHNFQQELNVHNAISTSNRMLSVKIVMLGYGVVLALLALSAEARKLLARFAIVAPPWSLVPSFLAAYWVYDDYPWKFSGEWVELMLGFGFLFAGIAAYRLYRDEFRILLRRLPSGLLRPIALVAATWVLAMILGTANAAISRSQLAADPEVLETARAELEALRRDFASGRVKTKCNRHKRIYSYVEKYDQDYLFEGEFAALTSQGLPEERAEFFLDPWNYAYWIRDRCRNDGRTRVVFVYSFGPNQRRESTRWKILGDDIGAIILSRGMDSEDEADEED